MSDRHKPTGLRAWCAHLAILFRFPAYLARRAAFRQEVLLSLLLIPAGSISAIRGSNAPCLVSPMLLILVVEILNSAVEAIVDRSGTERHPLAGMAKDMGSAAVMLSFALLEPFGS